MKIKSFVVVLSLSFICMSNVWASGSDDNEDATEFESSADSFERVVDPVYESGKAVFTGRKSESPKLSYCLKDGDQVIKLKRKSIKSYKETSYSKLASVLYSCDSPSVTIKEQLGRKEFIHVLYYLDKRYKLKLQRS